ncbi:cytochrome P450 [Thozetella sp. PMI_491]|nr:cytochrome P450 [Thozetella sp. PMI_491]
MSGLLMAGVTVVLLLAYRCLAYPCFFSPLASIPNAHWSAPLSRLWILRVRFARRENRTLAEAHRRLGPVVRVGPRELSVHGVDGVRTVYQGGFEKPVWYAVFDNYGVPCMFSARPAREHSARKRMISHVYSKSFIQSSAAAAAQAHTLVFGRLLPILEGSTAEHQEPHGVDIYSILMAATMDFIAGHIFGLRHGTNFLQNKGYRDHFFELYKSRNDYGLYDQELPRLTAVCRRLGVPFCPKWVDAANQELGEWCQELCRNMDEVSSAGADGVLTGADEPLVWNALASGLNKEAEVNGKDSILYPTALAQRELSVASELLDHVLAGQETSGLTLTYLTWRLSQSPALQNELRAELLTLRPSLKLERGGATQLPHPKQLDNLPLLHAVVMETLRLHAPIPGPQPRQAPEPSCTIGGHQVPGGVRIAALAYTMHRDEGAFPEPEEWRPERWLPATATEEERKERNRLFWAFSSGGRMCIGSNFAMQGASLPSSILRLHGG